MALTLYPDPNADSFIDLTTASETIAKLTLHSAEWEALAPETQEVYLRTSYFYIVGNSDESLMPDPMYDCVLDAQAVMAARDLVAGITEGETSTSNTGAIKRQKAGSVEREFYDSNINSKTVSRVPSAYNTCLEQIGFVPVINVTGLKQTTLGRS